MKSMNKKEIQKEREIVLETKTKKKAYELKKSRGNK